MASKQIGLGTIVKTDIATPSTYVAMTLVRAVTPPKRERAEVDALDLSDVLEVPLLGVESKSELSLRQHWHPGDTQHELFDTKFGNKGTFNVQIVTPHALPVTDQATYQVKALEPSEVQPNGTYERTVTLLRTSAITRTTAASTAAPTTT